MTHGFHQNGSRRKEFLLAPPPTPPAALTNCLSARHRLRQNVKEKVIAMRMSRYFLPVTKETPANAEIVSHKLMLRTGMIKQHSAGI